jgi:ribosome-binding protein aMBF1 (putative translation factor)
VSSGDISRIETGRLIPTNSQVRRLAAALEIQLSAGDEQAVAR